MAVPVAVAVAVAGEPYPLRHHGGDGAADLVVADIGGVRAQDHEEEADGQGHLKDGVQCHRGLQAHEGQRRLLQEGCAAWGEDGMGWGSRGDGHRDTGTQRHEDTEDMGTRAWGYGDMGTQEHGDMETWGHWDMGTRRHGYRDRVIWRQDDTEAWGHGGTKGMGHTKT